MARIRTIKPDFWTDEVLVQLPFHVRLVFIGLWNFADDYGALIDSPERLRLQILPADNDIDIGEAIDLLVVTGLLDRYRTEAGVQFLQIKNWQKHQKVDKPSQIRVGTEGSRKVAIPFSERQKLAKKYGCEPGGSADAQCYYCGALGRVHWHRRRDGSASSWVTFSYLEIDHFVPESLGGDTSAENFVLACRSCNRTKHTKDGVEFISRNSPSPREPSRALPAGKEGKGKEGKERKDQVPQAAPARPAKRACALPDDFSVTPEREQYAITRLPSVDVPELMESFKDYHRKEGTTAKDWDASWRTWVRNGLQFGYPKLKAADGKPVKREATPEQMDAAKRAAAEQNRRQLEKVLGTVGR